jgi:HK97 family phage major capsid protein
MALPPKGGFFMPKRRKTMTEAEKLEGLLTDIAGGVTAIKEETEKVKEEMAKNIEAIKAKQGEQDKILEILASKPKKETLPAMQGVTSGGPEMYTKEVPAWALPSSALGEKYYGFYMAHQGAKLRKFADSEFIEKMSRWWIDVLTGKAPRAIMEERTDLSEGTPAQGGYTVFPEYESIILALALDKSQIALPYCKVLPMGSNVKKVPAKLTGTTVSWGTEATDIGESTGPTVAEVTLTTKRLGAWKEASNEYIGDAFFDVASWLSDLFGEAIGLELDNQVLNGTGDPCYGVLTSAAGYSVTMGAGLTDFSDINGDHASEMMRNLREVDLAGARFVLHRTVFHYVRIMKDSQSAYIYGHPAGPSPKEIWGLPYVLSEKAPSTSAANTPFVSLGNFENFLIGRRQGDMTLFVNPYSLDKENQTRFKVDTRWAMAIGIANAFVRLLTAASGS